MICKDLSLIPIYYPQIRIREHATTESAWSGSFDVAVMVMESPIYAGEGAMVILNCGPMLSSPAMKNDSES